VILTKQLHLCIVATRHVLPGYEGCSDGKALIDHVTLSQLSKLQLTRI